MSAAALIQKAMLHMTKFEFEFIPDPHMYLFFEKGMRGGISYVFKRNNKSKNNYLISYDQKQESKYIIYLDTNNLYGYAMSKFLPTSGFKWIEPEDFDLNKYNSNSSKGCVLKVDLEYPKEIPKLHNNYPQAPDKIEIKREMLPNSQIKIAVYSKTMEENNENLKNRIDVSLKAMKNIL